MRCKVLQNKNYRIQEQYFYNLTEPSVRKLQKLETPPQKDSMATCMKTCCTENDCYCCSNTKTSICVALTTLSTQCFLFSADGTRDVLGLLREIYTELSKRYMFVIFQCWNEFSWPTSTSLQWNYKRHKLLVQSVIAYVALTKCTANPPPKRKFKFEETIYRCFTWNASSPFIRFTSSGSLIKS